MPIGSATTAAQRSRTNLIELGAEGGQVKNIQRMLNSHGAGLREDGAFGPKTDAAVRAFQRANNLTADGIVGRETMAKLQSSSAKPVPRNAEAPSEITPDGPRTRATGYRNGRPFPLQLASIGNSESLSERAAGRFLAMKEAARRDGVNLNVVSGFRTMDEQRSLYAAYKAGRGNLAAPPGYSQHQNGVAVDIETGGSRTSASFRWLRENGANFGFRNTVPSEPWHWQFMG